METTQPALGESWLKYISMSDTTSKIFRYTELWGENKKRKKGRREKRVKSDKKAKREKTMKKEEDG